MSLFSDEILERSLKEIVKTKPTPPPKPAASKPRFKSIEEYLRKEGT